MCDELSQSLAPQLRALGFTPPEEPFSHRTIKYDFTRRALTGVHVLEILFNKYRKPGFSVQIYVAPPSGVSMLTERRGTLVIGNVSSSPRKWPFSVQPFGAEPTCTQRMLGQPTDRTTEAVQLFLSLIPEIEEWWTHQRPTRHITVSKLNYPGTKRDA
jgi:hypothetical protein